MKIVYCITRSEWGGAQAHIFELIKSQIKKGNVTYLIVGQKGELYDRVMQLRNVHLVYLPLLQRSLNPFRDFNAILKLRKIIKLISPDILHLHSSKAGAIGRLAAVGLPCKVIFTVHGWAFTDGVSKYKSIIYVIIEQILSHITDKIICVSKFDYNIASKKHVFWKSNGTVIYNGVPEIIGAPIDRVQSDTDFINFIMIARFSKVQKRQDLLVEAAKLLSDVGVTHYHITFIGNGDRLSEVNKLVNKYNLENRITFLGFKKNPIKYFDSRSVATLISDYEGLPISLIEGMCAGRPILASDVGGVNELVKDNYNGLLTTEQPHDIEIAMKTLIEKSSEEFQELAFNSRNEYEKQFKIDRFILNTFECYTDVLR